MKEKQSKYCYPNSDVLINHFNIKDQVVLDKFERTITTSNMYELIDKPIKGKFDLKHLSNIHKFIFGDIYPFAGKIRDEVIWKGFRFASPEYIDQNAKELFGALQKENNLIGLERKEFVKRAAHYLAEINVLHPFREGNGRTQREFIRCLGLNAGHQIDWTRVDPEILLQASIRSVNHTDHLEKAINDCIVNDEPNKKIEITFKTPNRNIGFER